jgi:hypothetical protein
MPYVDFKAIKAAVSIEDATNLLKLTLKNSARVADLQRLSMRRSKTLSKVSVGR